ncbi:hypothetical protein X929_04495 [Petrotoga olearia DSM 13574]|uniref:Uncharacterized protein n=1 Tax=Petrotoga olearia DSM 13574 TaxID=1122955 RepID=A0A2K1P180_9BACT|nr:hypothetical protein X929_04495 [Petrotoga olearia DSM 13574]
MPARSNPAGKVEKNKIGGGEESSLANHPGTILALGHLFAKEIMKKSKK